MNKALMWILQRKYRVIFPSHLNLPVIIKLIISMTHLPFNYRSNMRWKFRKNYVLNNMKTSFDGQVFVVPH